MAPGYCHKGVCRAGLLAIEKGSSENVKRKASFDEDLVNDLDMSRKEKRSRTSEPRENMCIGDSDENATDSASKIHRKLMYQDFTYKIDFLSKFLDEERDHYNSLWSSSNCIGQREMRQWLHKLWVGKPGMRELLWKGACLALNAGKWLECAAEICSFHNYPSPSDDERLPVGTGSNPVYLMADSVVKIYIEGGLDSSIHGLGSELEFYNLLHQVNSPIKNHIPDVLASGILLYENGSYKTVPWDGKRVPDLIAVSDLIAGEHTEDTFPFGIWSKKQFESRKSRKPINELASSVSHTRIWPYIITKRCKGDIFANLRETMSWDDVLALASFLGDQLRNLHLLPLPSLHESSCLEKKQNVKLHPVTESNTERFDIPVEWGLFIETITRLKEDVSSRLAKWGDPIPSTLIEKVEEYIPDDVLMLLGAFKDENDKYKVCKSATWIHSDIMDDNIIMEPCTLNSCMSENATDDWRVGIGSENGYGGCREQKQWRPSYILDFSDLSIGDPIYDLIPIHLDIFRGDPHLLKQLLESYKLPLIRRSQYRIIEGGNKYGRLSYHAMCYCILHEENILGAIFSLWKELRTAKSWEEVEETVWGELNKYEGFC